MYKVTFKTDISNKIRVIKRLRHLTNQGLKEVKRAVDDSIPEDRPFLEDQDFTYTFTVLLSEEVFKELSKNVLLFEKNGERSDEGYSLTVESAIEIDLPNRYGKLM